MARLYPVAHIELNFTSSIEPLVAAILSARATDRWVNEVTRVLFARYCTARLERGEVPETYRFTG